VNKPVNSSTAKAGTGWKTPLGVFATLVAVFVVAVVVVSHFHPEKPFYIGQAYFPHGDSIEITSVGRTTESMTVKGRYNLVSHEEATLALYITSTNRNVPEDATQQIHISKGRGDFELVHSHLVPGWPHVNMYPVEGGKPFAEIYFGTQAEALEEGKLNLQSNNGPKPRFVDRLQKVIHRAPPTTDDNTQRLGAVAPVLPPRWRGRLGAGSGAAPAVSRPSSKRIGCPTSSPGRIIP